MNDPVADDHSEETETDWYSEDQATFGDRVVGAREAMGWSQKELAKRLGVKLKTVQGWEEDLSEPRANKLQMLAGILNISLVWLLTGDGEGVAEPDEGAVLPADVKELLAEMRQLRSRMKENIDQMGRLEKRLRTAIPDHL
ncbi:MAG: helix-turn-helix domain-containing protein [Marinosulfonomonas sp.]|nr:helix-turn-helix domain-containing protein [Marinosulfonomonas sp.]